MKKNDMMTKKEKQAEILKNRKRGLYTLYNNNNVTVDITSYGARIMGFSLPDKKGRIIPVVPGFSSIEEYKKSSSPYYGCIIGRFANRIANGKFSLNGKEYNLAKNNGAHNLHGGKGFQDAMWHVKHCNWKQIQLTYFSPDGEDGFPGSVTVDVTYTLNDLNELRIDYSASSNDDTIINLTNHAYFNLSGVGNGQIIDHYLIINADYITPVDKTLIPNGTYSKVDDTPFDFREAHLIGERIEYDDEQLKIGSGYDHNFVLNRTGDDDIQFAAKAWSDHTGILLEVYTTEPGLQFYTGNFMAGDNVFKDGSPDEYRTAFALETQHFPDSPNQPSFPSVTLKKGSQFTSTTIYKLSVADV